MMMSGGRSSGHMRRQSGEWRRSSRRRSNDETRRRRRASSYYAPLQLRFEAKPLALIVFLLFIKLEFVRRAYFRSRRKAKRNDGAATLFFKSTSLDFKRILLIP